LKKKPSAVLCLACLMLAAIPAGTLRAAKYPPGLHWREIERGGFTIIFPAARAAGAMFAVMALEAFNKQLAAFWGFRLPGRVRIVLNDATDRPNGFATFFPFNLVGADLAEPPPDSELATSFASLDLVLAHELTHLFTMNAGSPPFRAARRLFGSLPLLFPAVQMPAWVIEGLAVEGESRFTGDGRLNHPPYRLMLSAAHRDGLFPSWERIAGMPAAWPGGTAKYLFGAGFMEFLAKKSGTDSLREYLERVAARMILFSSSRDFKKVFGEPLDELWGNYRDSVPAAGKPDREPLTHNGFLKQYPCPLGEDKLLYYRRDYQSRGEVAVLNLKTGLDEPLFKMDGVNGISVAEYGKKILLSAVDNFHAFSEFSDLYEYDLEKGKLKRLSRGRRLSQPVKRENSGKIYCVQRRDGQYHLSLFESATKRLWVSSRPFAGMAQPAVNPNGQLIAAAVKPEGGPWGIALFWKDGEIFKFFSVPGSNLSQPRWLGEETLLFILSGKEDSRLAGYSFTENSSGPFPHGPSFSTDDSRLAGMQQFAVSDEEWDIFFTYYSGSGQEIGRLNFEDARWSPLEITVASGIPEVQPSLATAPAAQIRPYRFWRDLLPRWWAPAWRLAGDEFQAGIITDGQDSLGIHRYSLEGYFGFRSRRANIAARYVYDGLFPTLALAYSDSTDVFLDEGFSQRSQVLKLASLWPLRLRKRSQLHAYADLHLERRSMIYDLGATESSRSLNGARLGVEFNSALEYYDSVSPADGIRVTVQGSVQPAGMGNARTSRTIQADLRHYIPLFRPGVLAWRLAGARGWGSDPRLYALGGRQTGSGLGDSQPFHLLRGFPAGCQWGDRGWLFNLEYRLPLFKIEKAVLPAVSLDRVYLNTFVDAGRLWHGPDAFPAAYSAGVEAVLRLAFGGAAVYDLSCGAAYGFGPEKHRQVYARMGRSF
jgi:hypothetical protein